MTNMNFWREDNLRECIKYLLAEFSKCIREGVLGHYFIPGFNLLAIKLTPAAQCELLQLFDIIIESDISILKDCEYLQTTWSLFLRGIALGSYCIEYIICDRNKLLILTNDDCIIQHLESLDNYVVVFMCWRPHTFSEIFSQFQSLVCKTPLQNYVLKRSLLEMRIKSVTQIWNDRYKCLHELQCIAKNEMCYFDISTCKLWCAILLYMVGDYSSTLDIIDQVLSNIPPFAFHRHASLDAKQLYVDVFGCSDVTIIQKAKTAWMFQMIFLKALSYPLPLAIRIELCLSCIGIEISPLTCAYYLQFLCYFDLHQYENRDRALEQLVDFAKDAAEKQHTSISDLNIAGHCLLLAGKIAEARSLFNKSYTITQIHLPGIHDLNSACWYLLNCF